MMGGRERYEIFKGQNDQFYFHLKAGNGEVILASSGHDEKDDVYSVINKVRTAANGKKNFKRKKAKDGRFYFNLMYGEEILGTSQMYEDIQSRNSGVSAVYVVADRAAIRPLV